MTSSDGPERQSGPADAETHIMRRSTDYTTPDAGANNEGSLGTHSCCRDESAEPVRFAHNRASSAQDRTWHTAGRCRAPRLPCQPRALLRPAEPLQRLAVVTEQLESREVDTGRSRRQQPHMPELSLPTTGRRHRAQHFCLQISEDSCTGWQIRRSPRPRLLKLTVSCSLLGFDIRSTWNVVCSKTPVKRAVQRFSSEMAGGVAQTYPTPEVSSEPRRAPSRHTGQTEVKAEVLNCNTFLQLGQGVAT